MLAVNPDAVSSGALVAATPSPLGLHLPITKPAPGSQIVGAPKLTLSYSGQGTSSSAPVYAQIVDKKRNLVVGNMVTPIRLVLDGLPHTTTFTLEEIAASVDGGLLLRAAAHPGHVRVRAAARRGPGQRHEYLADPAGRL